MRRLRANLSGHVSEMGHSGGVDREGLARHNGAWATLIIPEVACGTNCYTLHNTSERETDVFSASREGGQEYSLENQLETDLGRLSTARNAEGLTDEERGIVGQAVLTYLASAPTTPPELDPEHDVLDAVQARNLIGFAGPSSLWWAVTSSSDVREFTEVGAEM